MSTIRTFRPADREGLVALINAAEEVDHIGEGTSPQEAEQWIGRPGFKPEENLFVFEEDARLVAYGYLMLFHEDNESVFRSWFQIHPMRRGRDYEDRMLALLYRRAEERLDECNADSVSFRCSANSPERARIAAMERFGMSKIRETWRMVCPTLNDLPEPYFPGGIHTRAYRRGEDDAAMHRVDGEVFRDHWGHSEMSFDMWQHYVAKSSFRPELSIIAEAQDGEIAGFCLVEISDEENKRIGTRRGWIDLLGTRRPYRRQGLGTALIVVGMHNLRSAGISQAALGCDSENITGATRIYKRVGFEVDNRHFIFKKPMRST